MDGEQQMVLNVEDRFAATIALDVGLRLRVRILQRLLSGIMSSQEYPFSLLQVRRTLQMTVLRHQLDSVQEILLKRLKIVLNRFSSINALH